MCTGVPLHARTERKHGHGPCHLASILLSRENGFAMRALIGLILALVIGFFVYKFYFAQVQPGGPGTAATQAISLTGVKNDLNAIAQAERMYQAQNGSYATLDELISSGALQMGRRGRDGYTYEVEVSGNGFTATARHTGGPGGVRWPTLVIDQTMQIRQTD